MDDSFWKNQFNTKLSPKQEAEFQAWLATQSKAQGRDMSNDTIDYDLRGHWLSGGSQDKGNGHFPDTYKKPNHPTFSNESKYHGKTAPWGGRLAGGKWTGDEAKGWAFEPTHEMLQNTHKLSDLRAYMAEVEPNAKLNLPAPYLPDKKPAWTPTTDIFNPNKQRLPIFPVEMK